MSTRWSRVRGGDGASFARTDRIVVIPRLLETAVRALATARTWVAPPSVPSPGERTVWTLSRISRWGYLLDVRKDGRQLGLAARYSRSCRAPMRSARSRTWPADSSPETTSAGVARGDPVGHLEEQRGLADPRLTRDQQDRAGDEAAPGPRRIGDAGRHGLRPGQLDLRDGSRGSGHRARGDPRREVAGEPNSWMVPQAWHSGQRPTHLAEA